MKFRFSIGRKIGIGFAILILLTISAFYVTQSTIDQSRAINDKINEVYAPSVSKLERLNLKLVQSKMLILKWVYFQSNDALPEKKELRTLIYNDYPKLKKEILEISRQWSKDEQEEIGRIFETIDELFAKHEEIIHSINSFDSYGDPSIMFIARGSVDDNDIDMGTKKALADLAKLIEVQRKNSVKISDEMLASFDLLQTIVRYVAIVLLVGGILIAIFTVRSIVRPIHELKTMLLSMGRGVLPLFRIKQRNDEIGEMSDALNHLIDGMEGTTQFAKEVGSGNFFSEYKPLSDEDSLGRALLKMREDLHTNEQILEAKVIERTEEVVRQKEEIGKQNEKLEELYKHVTDSIRYAKRLQDAILPPANYIKKVLPNSFVLFKPKDIVSGDFYWVSEKNNKTIFSAVDCTGHGVPGAFMSIVGHNLLKHVLNNTSHAEPASILDEVNKGVAETLHQGIDETSTKDGMDIAMCAIDYNSLELQYAGAFNPLYLVRDGALQQIKANKFPIGFFVDEDKKKFTNHKVQLQKGDCIYIFSDGYADQFGGPNGKKFMVKKFDELIAKVCNYPMEEQKSILERTIEDWKGPLEQVDDILVIGVRID
jgi:serine phosphatase RsbU (regulator of sigma subunit)